LSSRQKIGDVVDKSIYPRGLVAALEIGDGTLVLAEGMEFADEELSAISQYAGGFGKNGGQIFHVLKDEVAGDEIGEMIIARPALGEVGLGESDVGAVREFFVGARDHARRKIKGRHTFADMREKLSILAGAAASFDDRRVACIAHNTFEDGVVEIARGVLVRVVGLGPIVIGGLDGHGGIYCLIAARTNDLVLQSCCNLRQNLVQRHKPGQIEFFHCGQMQPVEGTAIHSARMTMLAQCS